VSQKLSRILLSRDFGARICLLPDIVAGSPNKSEVVKCTSARPAAALLGDPTLTSTYHISKCTGLRCTTWRIANRKSCMGGPRAGPIARPGGRSGEGRVGSVTSGELPDQPCSAMFVHFCSHLCVPRCLHGEGRTQRHFMNCVRATKMRVLSMALLQCVLHVCVWRMAGNKNQRPCARHPV
jgi:hypothetical protein